MPLPFPLRRAAEKNLPANSCTWMQKEIVLCELCWVVAMRVQCQHHRGAFLHDMHSSMASSLNATSTIALDDRDRPPVFEPVRSPAEFRLWCSITKPPQTTRVDGATLSKRIKSRDLFLAANRQLSKSQTVSVGSLPSAARDLVAALPPWVDNFASSPQSHPPRERSDSCRAIPSAVVGRTNLLQNVNAQANKKHPNRSTNAASSNLELRQEQQGNLD